MGRFGQKGLGRVFERTEFLNSPSAIPPSATDLLYNFSHVCDSEVPKCTILSMPSFQIIGRLEEGEQSIVLDLIVEPADSRWCFRCTALIDTGATGLFIDHAYVMHLDTQLHRLDSPVTIQNVDSTENRGGVIEFYADVFLETLDHHERVRLEVADLRKNQQVILGLRLMLDGDQVDTC
jgi:hypothetical protein